MEVLVTNITATCPLPFSGTAGELFAKAVAAVVASHCVIFSDYMWPRDRFQEILHSGQRTFDFIIVGAGTAGSALAGNLAEFNPDWSVLLVEAGDDPAVSSEVPSFFIYNRDNDWLYETETNGACFGFNENKCTWNKGKAVGGSSSINAMLYIRGHPNDYETWKRMGNTGWGYEDLKPYFDNIENKFNLSAYKYNENPWYSLLEQAYNEQGLNKITDNNEGRKGTTLTKLLIHNGKRLNTAKAYLKNSKNLYLIKNSIVQKVNLDNNSKRTTGIQLRHKSGIVMQINTVKEVVLSAGSIGTPQLLMLSGIGPKNHLNEKGIKCQLDLSVGKNLQDHIILPLFFKTNQETLISTENIILLIIQYMINRSGPLSTIGLTDFMSFINTKNDSDYPDVQFHHFYFNKDDKFFIRPYLEGNGYKKDIVVAIEQFIAQNDVIGIYPTLLHPKSRGEVLLRSKNPETRPWIITNYLREQEDLQTLLRAIKYLINMEATETFQYLKMKLLPIQLKDCQHQFNHSSIENDEYWECYTRHMATTIFHPGGTAKMGKAGDRTAVVDQNLLIHGMDNLRVVDASVMPTIPGGNVMAPTLVIAERAFQIIKRKHDLSKDEL